MSLTKKLLGGCVVVMAFSTWRAISKGPEADKPVAKAEVVAVADKPKPTPPRPEPVEPKKPAEPPITKDSKPVVEYLAEQARRQSTDPLKFDPSYEPQLGRLAFVDFLEVVQSLGEGSLVKTPDGSTLLLLGLDTSNVPTGGGITIEKALLIGPVIQYKTVLGANRGVLTATLVDLQKILDE